MIPVDLEEVERLLDTRVIGKAPGWPNQIKIRLDSTNTRAAELAASGAPEGVVVIARQQTAGRGRQARVWHSPPDSGIYMSFVLRPQLPPHELPIISLVAGVAVVDACEQVCGIKLGLKWVNDLVWEGRKVGGILAEMSSMQASVVPGTDVGSIQAAPVVLGIGINIALVEEDVPEELRSKVQWLERITGSTIDASALVAAICTMLESYYNDVQHGMQDLIIHLWKERSVTLGKEIRANLAGREVSGLAYDLGPNGALLVRTDAGEQLTLTGGEVSIRLPDGSYC